MLNFELVKKIENAQISLIKIVLSFIEYILIFPGQLILYLFAILNPYTVWNTYLHINLIVILLLDTSVEHL